MYYIPYAYTGPGELTMRPRLLLWCLLLLLAALPVWAQQSITPNWSHPLVRDLISWWLMAPALSGGLQVYDIISRNDATLTNMGFGVLSGWAPSDRRGGSWHVAFDGTDDYLLVGNLPVYDFGTQSWTVEGWAKAGSAPGSQYLIAKRRVDNSPPGGWFARLTSGGALNARLADGLGNAAAERTSVTTGLTTTTWFHWTVVFTGDTTTGANNDVTLYINGLLDQGTLTSSGDPYSACSCNLVLGTLSDLSTWLNGAQANMRVYRRGLTATEVFQVYTLGPQGDPGLLALPPVLVAAPMGGSPGSFFPFFR